MEVCVIVELHESFVAGNEQDGERGSSLESIEGFHMPHHNDCCHFLVLLKDWEPLEQLVELAGRIGEVQSKGCARNRCEIEAFGGWLAKVTKSVGNRSCSFTAEAHES